MGTRNNQTGNVLRSNRKTTFKSKHAITFEISKPLDFFSVRFLFNSLCEMDKKSSTLM